MAGIVNMFAASPYLGVLRFGGRTPTNPKGIVTSSPRLRGTTLGHSSEINSTATRLWQNPVLRRKRNCRNRVAVGNVCWTITQRSSFFATLDGISQASRRNPWDCRFFEI